MVSRCVSSSFLKVLFVLLLSSSSGATVGLRFQNENSVIHEKIEEEAPDMKFKLNSPRNALRQMLESRLSILKCITIVIGPQIEQPSMAPSVSHAPTASMSPSSIPTVSPEPSTKPSLKPTSKPTFSSQPSAVPSSKPTKKKPSGSVTITIPFYP